MQPDLIGDIQSHTTPQMDVVEAVLTSCRHNINPQKWLASPPHATSSSHVCLPAALTSCCLTFVVDRCGDEAHTDVLTGEWAG